jgi:hypothetical protein
VPSQGPDGGFRSLARALEREIGHAQTRDGLRARDKRERNELNARYWNTPRRSEGPRGIRLGDRQVLIPGEFARNIPPRNIDPVMNLGLELPWHSAMQGIEDCLQQHWR